MEKKLFIDRDCVPNMISVNAYLGPAWVVSLQKKKPPPSRGTRKNIESTLLIREMETFKSFFCERARTKPTKCLCGRLSH